MKVVSAIIEGGGSEIVTDTLQNKEENVDTEKSSEIQDLLRTHDGAENKGGER